jgi:AmmeMemoRadiSam system protein B
MDREPVVAGQFYPKDPAALEREVLGYLGLAESRENERTLLAMCPHAGYVFSGAVAGQTLGRANLAPLVLLLGPNHTGRGVPLSLWDRGAWRFPGGQLQVDAELAKALLDMAPRLSVNYDAHLYEHSLEVLLPFLRCINPETRIVPVAVAEPRVETLVELGGQIANVLATWKEPVSIVVSSDMSHYVSHAEAERRDRYALDKMVEVSPEGLYRTVRQLGISMCGVYPMTVGLAACRALGAREGALVAYATSGEVSGDYDRVVGYAGVLVPE